MAAGLLEGAVGDFEGTVGLLEEDAAVAFGAVVAAGAATDPSGTAAPAGLGAVGAVGVALAVDVDAATGAEGEVAGGTDATAPEVGALGAEASLAVVATFEGPDEVGATVDASEVFSPWIGVPSGRSVLTRVAGRASSR